jgi:hypothetical protein
MTSFAVGVDYQAYDQGAQLTGGPSVGMLYR